ncbi:hypothetical protein C7S16_0717 [Burkholderia thailandensis]|uniref:Uncharacterized protein n=1 Tax=Burkholderia thailandensis TaxID=57975 RepID=A0AAW9D4W8_BURTH|nr:hypothetical protein [Burkholderia thailandensis]MDW9256919.1 hypothetical protein [Burkholderia thailandensis]
MSAWTHAAPARQERLRALGQAEAAHPALAFTRGRWRFSARLLARAAALTKTCFALINAGISAFAAR